MIYKALSVVAPAGGWIRSGKKTIEVRQWTPDLELPIYNLLIIQNRHKLSSKGLSYDPNGTVMAMVDVLKIRIWTLTDLDASSSKKWEPGWLAWELTNIRPLYNDESQPAKLRIYELEIDLEKMK